MRIRVHCDNESAVAALNKGYSNKCVMSDLLRVLVYLSMINNFSLKSRHVKGKLNVKSDLLSRLQVAKFLRLFPQALQQPTPVPPDPLASYVELYGVSLV